MIHPYAWVIWLCTALVALSATRNPLYLVLVLLCIAIVATAVRSQNETPLPVTPARFAVIVVTLSALFNAATVHVGDTVLFRVPRVVPVVGGPITLEAIAFGALNGLALAGFYAAFTVLNAALSTRELIRLVPRAFHPVAVVVSIAITFVPTMLEQMTQIREAQAIRGHRVRGVRDWLPLFMPLLVGGMERALQLGEALTARGFAGGDREQTLWPRAALVWGLTTLLAGWLLRLAWGRTLVGLVLMAAGAGIVLTTLWLLGRGVPRTVYRPRTWHFIDWTVIVSALLVLAGFILPLPFIDQRTLAYTPYPALEWPPFDLRVGMLTLALLWPVVLVEQTSGDNRAQIRKTE